MESTQQRGCVCMCIICAKRRARTRERAPGAPLGAVWLQQHSPGAERWTRWCAFCSPPPLSRERAPGLFERRLVGGAESRGTSYVTQVVKQVSPLSRGRSEKRVCVLYVYAVVLLHWGVVYRCLRGVYTIQASIWREVCGLDSGWELKKKDSFVIWKWEIYFLEQVWLLLLYV